MSAASAWRTRGRPVVALAALLCHSLAFADVSIERLDHRFDQIVPRGTRIEKIVDGFRWLEGPAWSGAGASLFFSDIPGNTVYRWRRGGGAAPVLERSGYEGEIPFAGREPGSNGLAFDATGRLLLAEHGNRRITRLEPDGRRTVLIDRFEGRRLNSPNDLVLHRNGDLYFTDPPFGLPGTFTDPERELPWSGVYRLSPDGAAILLTAELDGPNGLAFSPDGRILYVSNADPKRPLWMAYPVRHDGRLGKGKVFRDAATMARSDPGYPDGMKVDRDGNLFAAGPGGIYVFAADGGLLGRLHFGIATSNCAFGEDGSTVFVTAATAIYRIRLNTIGQGFPTPPPVEGKP